jgi:hypothetical protein
MNRALNPRCSPAKRAFAFCINFPAMHSFGTVRAQAAAAWYLGAPKDSSKGSVVWFGSDRGTTATAGDAVHRNVAAC